MDKEKDKNDGCAADIVGCLITCLFLIFAVVLFVVLVCKHGWDVAIESYWGELWDTYFGFLKVCFKCIVYCFGGLLALSAVLYPIQLLVDKIHKKKSKGEDEKNDGEQKE